MNPLDAQSPEDVKCAVRALRSLPRCEVLGDANFHQRENAWALRLRLRVEHPTAYVPALTEWYLFIDATYPLGTIGIYPAKTEGITATFPHQERNLIGDSNLPWRTGKLCLERRIVKFGDHASQSEPFGDVESRLRWHVTRALAWLDSATSDALIEAGDPFELPQYPSFKNLPRVVHDESEKSHQIWLACPDAMGLAVLDSGSPAANALFVATFETFTGQVIRSSAHYNAQRHSREVKSRWECIWWRWPAPIVLEPWEVPTSWGSLRRVGQRLHVDVDRYLRRAAKFLRGKRAPTLLLGYSVPLRKGELPSEICWQAIAVPETKTDAPPPNGFRANEEGQWQRDRRITFGDSATISYMNTENWHTDRLQARGSLNTDIKNKRFAIIGVGALGASVVELLARAGVSSFLIIDPDILHVGNLVRHTLTLKELGNFKVEGIRARLSAISPYIQADSINESLSPLHELDACQVVVDCTGSDDTLVTLSTAWSPIPRLFVSSSVGYRAQKTFIYGSVGHTFPYKLFREKIDPILAQERNEWAMAGETLEGAGCWSPLFPARLDDIWLAAIASVKVIEEFIMLGLEKDRLTIFEKAQEDFIFNGLRRALLEGGE